MTDASILMMMMIIVELLQWLVNYSTSRLMSRSGLIDYYKYNLTNDNSIIEDYIDFYKRRLDRTINTEI